MELHRHTRSTGRLQPAGPAGHSRSEDALYAFKLGISQLPGAKKQPSPNELPAVSPAELTSGLGRLGQATPKIKQAIVDACAHRVLADNDVTPAEMSLLRAVVLTLDCPVPPFLTPTFCISNNN